MQNQVIQILFYASWFLNPTLAKKVCSTIQLEAYCDIQTTSYTSIYQKQELYEYDESYINIMTDIEKKSDSSSSKGSGSSFGFKGFTFSGNSQTSNMLKTYFKKSHNIVTHKIKERYSSEEKKHTFQAGSYQYFRVITSILSLDGHVYETTSKALVYSSPKHNEYDLTLERYSVP